MDGIIFQKKMVKLCGLSLALNLKIIFEAALNDSVFPDDWKKGNIVPVHRKDLKTMLMNYRPINVLPIFAQIFEIIISTSMSVYFIKNEIFFLSAKYLRITRPCFQKVKISKNQNKK